MTRYVRNEWGYFFAVGYGLIGHDSCDVTLWLEGHPAYHDAVYFNYGDGGNDVDVTEIFWPAEEEAAVDAALARMGAAA